MMNEKLQQAISAARNGQEIEAQMLLTQALKENPNETQAWFLLSTLVNSEQKKRAYLGKVLALEPDHQMAQKMLGRLQPEKTVETNVVAETETEAEMAAETGLEEEDASSAPVVVSQNAGDFLGQQKGDTLPAWLIAEEGLEISEGGAAVEMEAVEEILSHEEEAIPDWLQDEVPESWSEETPAEETVLIVDDLPEKKKDIVREPKPESKSVAEADKKKQDSFLAAILYALVATAVVIFVIMIYLAWSTFF